MPKKHIKYEAQIGDRVSVTGLRCGEEGSFYSRFVGKNGTIMKADPHFVNSDFGCSACSEDNPCNHGGIDYDINFDEPIDGRLYSHMPACTLLFEREQSQLEFDFLMEESCEEAYEMP